MNFNSYDYSWVDIKVRMLGRTVTGLKALSYSVSQPKTNVYGSGSKPIGRTRGQKQYAGTITLTQDELENLQATVGRGADVLDIKPFDVVVSYSKDDGPQRTDVLVGVEFTSVPKQMGNTDDGGMSVQLDIIMGDVQYGV